MGDFRCAFPLKAIDGHLLKAIDGHLQRRIGFCHTLMLPQMLQPGIDEKGLNKSTFIHRILEYSPVVCAVAAPLPREFGDRLQERFALRRIDVVFP
jgi:hypothetical protein